MSFLRTARLVSALLFLAAGAGAARADGYGGLAVVPVRVDLAPGRRAEAVTLTNTGAARRTVEVQAFAWAQENGKDIYTPTDELLANPPLFHLQPGASQIVRIGRPAGAKPAAGPERAFRVFFSEVPAPQAANGLRLALRIGIPVFVAGHAGKAELYWAATRHADHSLTLQVANRGTAHARVANLSVLGDDPSEDLRADGFRYVLPGASQTWRLMPPRPLPLGLMRLSALTEGGRAEFELVAVPD